MSRLLISLSSLYTNCLAGIADTLVPDGSWPRLAGSGLAALKRLEGVSGRSIADPFSRAVGYRMSRIRTYQRDVGRFKASVQRFAQLRQT
jgi:hypothetical protein